MKSKFKLFAYVSMILAIMTAGAIREASAGEVMVIANPSVPAENLDPESVQNIFLGKTVQWKNNDMVTIVVSEKVEVHEMFLQKYIKRTNNQFNNVWRQNLFTGTGKQPVKANSLEELIQYVAKTPGAIGYISSDVPLPKDVKVISK